MQNTHTTASGKIERKSFGIRSFILTFFILFFFWVVFSGRFDVFHISLGAVSCLIVASLSRDLLFPNGVKKTLPGTWLRFIGYVPWLCYQIFLANLHVLYLVFHPRMMELIDPHMMDFTSRLKTDISRTTFANSITLTPGTITVSVSILNRFTVHCIDTHSGESLPGEMERKIQRIFREP